MSGRAGWLVLVLTAGVASSCAVQTAPAGFLPDVKQAQTSTHGGWIDLTFRSSTAGGNAAGELIAVTGDSLWIMGASSVVAIPTGDVVSGQFVAYDSRPNQVVGATFAGVLSTISNGYFLVFTAPMWIIGGAAAAAAQSRIPLRELPVERWMDLGKYARFPQGIPGSVDVSRLRPAGR